MVNISEKFKSKSIKKITGNLKGGGGLLLLGTCKLEC